jgi:hypothetical protein
LRGEVAGDREEAVLLRRIHHRQLPTLQRVVLVGIDLVHHVDQRIVVGDQQALLAIGREVHVAGFQRPAEGGDGLLAEMLHVERGLALPLRHQHARIEGAQRHHVPEAFDQFLVGQRPGPRADSLALAVEDTNNREGETADRFRIGVDRRALDRTGLGNDHVGEVRRAAWTHFRFRHMKAQGR